MIANKLRDTRGSIALSYAFQLLGFALLLSIGMQVAQVWITADVAKGKTTEAVLAVAAINVENVYHGVRESAGQARTVDAQGTEWDYPVAAEEVLDIMVSNMNLARSGQTLTKYDSKNQKVYSLSDMQVTYDNVENGLHFTTTYIVEVPLHIGADLLPSVTFKQRVDSTYERKF